METLIHADIFFFVTTFIVILVGIGLIIIMVYAIQIMRKLRDIAEIARTETDLIVDDVHILRSKIHRGTFNWTSIIHFFRSILGRHRPLK